MDGTALDPSVVTVADNLRDMVKSIKGELETLILKHSSIYRFNNLYTSGIVSVGGDYTWKALDEEGHRLQSKVHTEYRRLFGLVSTLLRGQPEATRRQAVDLDRSITAIVEQSGITWMPDTRQVFQDVVQQLDELIDLVGRLHDPSSCSALYVPDTNALIHNPDIDGWTFADVREYTIVLTPVVLSELDSLKINHRVPEVRDKAHGLIRRIKEFRRRGSLLAGVPLVKGKSRLASVASEPDMEHTLDWLDSGNHDDRLIALTIEVMRLHPRSAVILVTGDINLQNKAELACVPFVEPPDKA